MFAPRYHVMIVATHFVPVTTANTYWRDAR